MGFLAPVLGGVASAGASFGLSKLFGGDKNAMAPLREFRPTGIDAGGLSSTFGGGNIGITPSSQRLVFTGGLAATFPEQAATLAKLRESVAPGISGLRSARLKEIDDARRSSIGNLRENLSRRRVLGSSFGQDAISRAEAEFGKERERVAAESFLQEMEMTNNLIQQEFTARRGEFQTFLGELNLEAEVASGLAGKAIDVLGKNAQMESALNAQSAAGAGKFFGQTFQPVISGIGKGVSDFMSSKSSPAPFSFSSPFTGFEPTSI